MRVLIIGGTGLSGPYLVRELVSRGHEVTIFHRGQHEADLPEAVAHVHGDRRESGTLRQAGAALHVDGVVDMTAMNDEDAASLISENAAIRRYQAALRA